MFKFKRSRLIARSMGVAVAGGAIAVAAVTIGSAVPAGAAPQPALTTVSGTATLNQGNVPTTALGFGTHEQCPSDRVPPSEDGFIFVLRGSAQTMSFVSITVSYTLNGVKDSVTSTGPFGPPTDKFAFVGLPAGAVLTGATATISGTTVPLPTTFELTGTCPASSTSPSPSQIPSQSPSPSGSPSTSPPSPPQAPPPVPEHTTLPVTG